MRPRPRHGRRVAYLATPIGVAMLRIFRARRELAQLREDLDRTRITVRSESGLIVAGPMSLFEFMLIAKYGGYSMDGPLPPIVVGMVYVDRLAR